jgi:hypothetical protein
MNSVIKACSLAFFVMTSTAGAQQAERLEASPKSFLSLSNSTFASPETASFNPHLVVSADELNLLDASPQFSFNSAQDAFDSGIAPSISEISGNWMLAGEVRNPSLPPGVLEGYWPDGKFKHPSLGSGFFKCIASMSNPVRDAFGKTILTISWRMVGVESGKVYSTKGPYRGVIASSGYKFDGPDSASSECRVVQSSGMFLCAVSDSRGINSFAGFIKTP